MSFEIRQATREDIPMIEEMYRTRVSFNDANDIHQWRHDQVTWDAFRELYTIEEYYVATLEKIIVGGCFIVDVDELYWPNHAKGEALYLHKIVVHPEHSGHGYADQLISFFKEKGKKEHYPCVRIDVREKKDKLRAMYERNGFLLQKVAQFVPEFSTALYQFDF